MVKSAPKSSENSRTCALPLDKNPYKLCCLQMLQDSSMMQTEMERMGAKAVIDRIRGCFPGQIVDLRPLDLSKIDVTGVNFLPDMTIVSFGIFQAVNAHLAFFDGESTVKARVIAPPELRP